MQTEGRIKKILRKLLEPLRVKIIDVGISKLGKPLMTLSSFDNRTVFFQENEKSFYKMLSTADVENIWKVVSSTRSFFVDEEDGKIENPYFGCESLEEALVRRDLLEE